MSRPGAGRVTRVLEPSDPPQCVILIDAAIAFTRSAAVAATHDVQEPIAVDIRQLQASHAIRRERSDEMCNPRVIDPLRLLEPIEPPVGGANNVEPAVPVQVRVLEVESGRPRTGDADGVLPKAECFVAQVLEEQQPVLAPGAHDDVEIAVAVEIDRLGVLRHAVAPEHGFLPVARDEWVAGYLIEGHGRRSCEVRGPRPLCALVGGGHLGHTVAVEVGEEHANVGTAPLGHRKDQPWPVGGAGVGTRILQIDEVRQFRGHHHIEISVAVHVGDGGVLRGRCVGAFGERGVDPAVGVAGTERDAHVALGVRDEVRVGHAGVVFAVRLVHRDDVLVAIIVDVRHDQAIAAAQGEARGLRLVDDVFAPADVGPVLGTRRGRRVAHGHLRVRRVGP